MVNARIAGASLSSYLLLSDVVNESQAKSGETCLTRTKRNFSWPQWDASRASKSNIGCTI
jgi:hypothetical protein